jgi:predicted ATP-dependent serine protease
VVRPLRARRIRRGAERLGAGRMTATPPDPTATKPTEPPALPRVETGIPGLDDVSLGGLPRGRVTMVAGPAGSAKTVLAGQFLANGARSGEPGVFVTLEEPEADLRRNLTTLGLDIAALEEGGDWAFVDAAPRYDPDQDQDLPVRIDTLAAQIGQAIDRTGATRVVIDSYGSAASTPTTGEDGSGCARCSPTCAGWVPRSSSPSRPAPPWGASCPGTASRSSSPTQ